MSRRVQCDYAQAACRRARDETLGAVEELMRLVLPAAPADEELEASEECAEAAAGEASKKRKPPRSGPAVTPAAAGA